MTERMTAAEYRALADRREKAPEAVQNQHGGIRGTDTPENARVRQAAREGFVGRVVEDGDETWIFDAAAFRRQYSRALRLLKEYQGAVGVRVELTITRREKP